MSCMNDGFWIPIPVFRISVMFLAFQRNDLFITSKIWNTFHSYENAQRNIDMILNELNLELVFIHGNNFEASIFSYRIT
jgi:diketogulonate reductase-like aldo/keto reductase